MVPAEKNHHENRADNGPVSYRLPEIRVEYAFAMPADLVHPFLFSEFFQPIAVKLVLSVN